MTTHEITLVASESNWRLFMVRKSDQAFLKFQEKVLRRDAYQCQFCGYCHPKQLEIVNLDHDYHNNKLANLVSACVFCAQCFFLEAIGKGNFAGGHLVYLPEMTQAQVNGLCHVLFTKMISGCQMATQARNVYRSLRLRAQIVEKALGEGMSNPSLYGRLLIDAEPELRDNIHRQVVEDLRVLPDFAPYTPLIYQLVVDSFKELQDYCDNSTSG